MRLQKFSAKYLFFAYNQRVIFNRRKERWRNCYQVLFLIIATATLLLFAVSLSAATVQWNTDSSDYWNIAGNWTSDPSLPGPTDDVVIDRSTSDITVTHNTGSDTINSLICNESLILSGGTISVANASQINGTFTLSGGTINGTGAIEVVGAMNWSGGTISGSGGVFVSSEGSLTISGNSSKSLTGSLLSNAGRLRHDG